MAIIIPYKKSSLTGLDRKSAKLVTLVNQMIADQPFVLDGQLWAARSQREWADILGVSVATLRRVISKPPFVRDRTHNSAGYIITVLRIGKAGPKTPRHLANIMAKIFEKKTKRRPSNRGYGCLVGCAELWPEGHQIEIFKLVMNEWAKFMVGFRLALDTNQIQPPNTKTYEKPVEYLKLQYPHLPTLRLGASVAFEFYQMHMQDKVAYG